MTARDQYERSFTACDALLTELMNWLIDHDEENLEREINSADQHTMHELHVKLADIVEWIKEGCE